MAATHYWRQSLKLCTACSHILLIHSPTEMCLVTTEENCLLSNLCKHLLTHVLAFGVVCCAQSLRYHYFEGWKFKSKCRILLKLRSNIPMATACHRIERLGDYCSHQLHIFWYCDDMFGYLYLFFVYYQFPSTARTKLSSH